MSKKVRQPSMGNFLSADGWLTPDTYAGWFETLPAVSGVYLLLCFDGNSIPLGVGYVGCAKNLRQRLSNHDVIRRMMVDGLSPQRWFKTVPAQYIREVEKSYILRFDPAYNIIGRRQSRPQVSAFGLEAA